MDGITSSKQRLLSNKFSIEPRSNDRKFNYLSDGI